MVDDKIHIHIDTTEQRDGLPEFQEDCCPKCKGPVQVGFGLAGGGYGVYSYCDICEMVVSKSQTPD
jgi:hypothetical protein